MPCLSPEGRHGAGVHPVRVSGGPLTHCCRDFVGSARRFSPETLQTRAGEPTGGLERLLPAGVVMDYRLRATGRLWGSTARAGRGADGGGRPTLHRRPLGVGGRWGCSAAPSLGPKEEAELMSDVTQAREEGGRADGRWAQEGSRRGRRAEGCPTSRCTCVGASLVFVGLVKSVKRRRWAHSMLRKCRAIGKHLHTLSGFVQEQASPRTSGRRRRHTAHSSQGPEVPVARTGHPSPLVRLGPRTWAVESSGRRVLGLRRADPAGTGTVGHALPSAREAWGLHGFVSGAAGKHVQGVWGVRPPLGSRWPEAPRPGTERGDTATHGCSVRRGNPDCGRRTVSAPAGAAEMEDTWARSRAGSCVPSEPGTYADRRASVLRSP